MTAIDIITLLLIGIMGGLGFMRGFVTEILSLVAWVVAFIAVRVFEPLLADALTGVVGTSAGAAVLSVALLFGGAYFVGRQIARGFGRSARRSVLGPVDRLLGLGFGAIKGLFGAVLMFAVLALGVDLIYGGAEARPQWMVASQTYPMLNSAAGTLVDLVKARQGQHHKRARHSVDSETA